MPDFSSDQQAAYDGILAWKRDPHGPQTAGLTGFAGCGKTFLIASLVSEGGIHYCTPTAQAASVLNRNLPDNNRATTLHRFLREYKRPPASLDPLASQEWEYRLRNSSEFLHLDLIIADESSMMSGDIQKELRDTGRKILFVGDTAQLGPVNKDDPMAPELLKPDWHLSKLHRYVETHPLRLLGEAARSTPLPDLKRFANAGKITFLPRNRLKDLCKVLWHNITPEQLPRIAFITDTNRLRVDVNRWIRKIVHKKNLTDVPIPGDRIVFLKNERTSRVFNGMRATVLSIQGEDDNIIRLEVQPDFEAPFITWVEKGKFNNPNDLPWKKWQKSVADYAYASTCHKAQGDQFETVVTLAGPSFGESQENLSWAYTSISRAQDRVFILV